DDLVLEALVALDHGAADDRVQSGAVATGGQNSDLHGRSSLPSGTSRRGHRWGGGVARWPGRAGTSRHERAAAPTLRSEAALRRRGRLWRPRRQAVRAAQRPHRTHAAAPALRAERPGRRMWRDHPVAQMLAAASSPVSSVSSSWSTTTGTVPRCGDPASDSARTSCPPSAARCRVSWKSTPVVDLTMSITWARPTEMFWPIFASPSVENTDRFSMFEYGEASSLATFGSTSSTWARTAASLNCL